MEENQVVNNQTSVSSNQSLEASLSNLQDKWTETVRQLNEQMKTMPGLDTMMNEVYMRRQDAIDLYYGTMKIQSARTRDYKVKASNIYNALKSGQNGLRYTNEAAITMQIEAKLSAEKECIDLLTNFTNFMKETVQTIDNIIYGINPKIKIYEMINGLKF